MLTDREVQAYKAAIARLSDRQLGDTYYVIHAQDIISDNDWHRLELITDERHARQGEVHEDTPTINPPWWEVTR